MLKENKPRHEQISDWLRHKIATGQYNVGDQLPSENELSVRFDVSRVTVRHALKTLESEGIIYRRQGLGSFVDEADINQPLVCLTDFDEDMKRAGLQSSSAIISREIVDTPVRVAHKLDLSSGTKVVRLDRIRKGDGKAIAFDQTWLPMLYGQLLEGHDLEQTTIYSILEKNYEIPILQGLYNISATSADDYLARYLSIEKGHPLLLIDRLSMSIGKKKIYYQQRYYLPESVSYQVQLERRDEQSEYMNKGMPLKDFFPVFSGKK